MKMKISAFLICLFALLLLDIAWFAISLDRFYRPLMGDLLNPAPNLYAAAAFYALYAACLCYFAVLREGGLLMVVKNAAILGLCAFATYDLTALAVINGFSLALSIIDMLWGVFAAVTSSALSRIALNHLFKTR